MKIKLFYLWRKYLPTPCKCTVLDTLSSTFETESSKCNLPFMTNKKTFQTNNIFVKECKILY